MPVLELLYVDETGTKGTTTVKYPVGTTYAVVDADAAVLASLIAPLTGCVLMRQRIIFKAVAIPRLEPIPGSSVIQSGVFIFSDGTADNLNLFEVPGILDSILETTGNGAGVLIDLTNSDVIALIDAYIAADLTNVFGTVCETLEAAYRQSRGL